MSREPELADALRYEALTQTHVPALARLFERAESGCYCRYWHFEGDKNAWQARLAFEPEQNLQELAERATNATLGGVVAGSSAGEVVGWMKLEPARAVPKLYAQRTYRALSCFEGPRDGVWTVGCFLVDAERRRRGVARGLLRTGIELARAAGATRIEAFPRRAEGVRAEELWTGPLALFESAGFEIIQGEGQYPVLRRLL